VTAANSIKRPAKPYPEFPLYAHSRGYWCKTYQGKKYNCGPWDDPQAALRRWEEIRNALEVGNDPCPKSGSLNVDRLVNAFLDSKDLQVQAGDLSPATFNQYRDLCRWLKEYLGASRLVESLGPADFSKLRSRFNPAWGVSHVSNVITVIRCVFKWGYDAALLEKPVRYGTNLSMPSAKRRKLERASKPRKFFTASEIWAMHDAANERMRCWILLGLNCGYGNIDLARLRASDVQSEWLEVPRGKTGEDRKAWLFPETREAIRRVAEGKKPDDLLFKTRYGKPLVANDGTRNVVSDEFKELKAACNCDRHGVGFYALRHVFETVAGETSDQVAVNYVMGHSDNSMAAIYREGISDERVKKVCSAVREWFLAGKPRRKAK